ncbi:RDD family protein [Prosthecobacter sp.]|uniref:RDD family protein n=1 Tax=Prosthecobacter sp. TaxID=1965333 RepID=UPI003784C730
MSTIHIARNGQQLGVFAEDAIQSGLSSGQFMPDDLFWTEGMGEWQPLSSRFAVSTAVSTSPYNAGVFNPYAAPSANVQTPVLAGNVQLADLGKRLGAALLDGLLGAILVGVPYGFFIFAMSDNGRQPELNPTAMIAGGCMLLGFLALLVINIVMLATRGQTPGKRVLGIRIATYPGAEKPGFVKAFLLRALVNGLIGAVPCLGPIYSLVDICFIFQTDRRCIHDLIAGTHVIEGNPPDA